VCAAIVQLELIFAPRGGSLGQKWLPFANIHLHEGSDPLHWSGSQSKQGQAMTYQSYVAHVYRGIALPEEVVCNICVRLAVVDSNGLALGY
jgi:hypothetical protein